VQVIDPFKESLGRGGDLADRILAHVTKRRLHIVQDGKQRALASAMPLRNIAYCLCHIILDTAL
jgi:hypothetical protein